MEVKKIKQGDVLCYTWGSEQTNVDFFYVRKRTPKCVYLIPVPSETVGIPKKGSFVREVKPKLSGCVEGYESRKKIGMSYHGDAEMVRMDYGWARIWDGKPVTETSYA